MVVSLNNNKKVTQRFFKMTFVKYDISLCWFEAIPHMLELSSICVPNGSWGSNFWKVQFSAAVQMGFQAEGAHRCGHPQPPASQELQDCALGPLEVIAMTLAVILRQKEHCKGSSQ